METYVIEGIPKPSYDLKQNEPVHTHEYDVKKLAQKLRQQLPSKKLLVKPICMKIMFYMRMPINFKRGMNSINPYPLKPNLDEMTKIVLQAFENIIFKDASIVAHLDVTKVYSELPRTEIEITSWETYEKTRNQEG